MEGRAAATHIPNIASLGRRRRHLVPTRIIGRPDPAGVPASPTRRPERRAQTPRPNPDHRASLRAWASECWMLAVAHVAATWNCPVGATGSERSLGSGVGLLGRRLLNVCVKFSEDEVESSVRSTSTDTLSDQPLSEWPAGRDADRTLAQRTAAVGLTDRGSLSELALITDHRCGMLMTVVREAWRSEAGLTGSPSTLNCRVKVLELD